MKDKAFRRRFMNTRSGAVRKLEETGYGVLTFDEGPFSIIAVRPSEARFVRVVMGQIRQDDLQACREVTVPAGCVREVWARHGNPMEFEIKEV